MISSFFLNKMEFFLELRRKLYVVSRNFQLPKTHDCSLIENSAFSQCFELVDFEIPPSVEIIDELAFRLFKKSILKYHHI